MQTPSRHLSPAVDNYVKMSMPECSVIQTQNDFNMSTNRGPNKSNYQSNIMSSQHMSSRPSTRANAMAERQKLSQIIEKNGFGGFFNRRSMGGTSASSSYNFVLPRKSKVLGLHAQKFVSVVNVPKKICN